MVIETILRRSRKPLQAVKVCRGFESLPLRLGSLRACIRAILGSGARPDPRDDPDVISTGWRKSGCAGTPDDRKSIARWRLKLPDGPSNHRQPELHVSACPPPPVQVARPRASRCATEAAARPAAVVRATAARRYQAQVYSPRDRKTLRKTFGSLTDARAWRSEPTPP